MKEQTDLKNILKKGVLSDELDLERALILDRKLRLLVKEYPEYAKNREQLRSMIKSYEQVNWSSDSTVTEDTVKESDNAEFIAEQERLFLAKRKEAIKGQLVRYELTQQDLGKLLGHNKSYMSELMNGISPFSNRDLIILHRLFHIGLEDLIPTVISQKDRVKLKESLSQLNKLRLGKEDLMLA
jgi:hypothetical protein